MTLVKEEFFGALSARGMPEIPQDFSVVPLAQLIPHTTLVEIDNFMRLFDRITTGTTWQRVVTASAPEIARFARSEVCFFTAWDFHLSPEQGWQLIECNDNGSGFLFAALINRLFYELSNLAQERAIEEPPSMDAFRKQLAFFIEREAKSFLAPYPMVCFLFLKLRERSVAANFTGNSSCSAIFCATVAGTRKSALLRISGGTAIICFWIGGRWPSLSIVLPISSGKQKHFLRYVQPIWKAKCMSRPTRFTYATRSDKRLLEFLSLPNWDQELGILPEERAVLSAHVPATYLLREENLDEIAAKKTAFFFKPAHGFASHGVLTSSQVGKRRLRQLLRKKSAYVAQKTVPKPTLVSEGKDGKVTLWTDLRVWAYRGERYLISGRASKQRDLLDLAPPGGWLATFETKQAG